MGTITSSNQQRQKEREEKKKGNNKFKNGKIPCCDFCDDRARQTITDTKGKIVFSCFNCIPPNGNNLSWIRSTEEI